MYEHLKKKAQSCEEAIQRLIDIVELLRKECPWDREQTHESLKICLIEEAYEVIEAIDNKDCENLKEELGDVLLQVVFHSSLAENTGNFSIIDVANDECEKMIRRHPHVFLKENAETIDKVLEKWENIKVKEVGDSSVKGKLKAVPKSFPALMRSSKVQKKAVQNGFMFSELSECFEELAEETEGIRDNYECLDKAQLSKLIGKLIFLVVIIARDFDIDPEEALNKTTEMFIDDFQSDEEN